MTANLTVSAIETKIFTLRGVQVMIDRDLAELYGVETRVLNQAVKRNMERFPEHFMFQITVSELDKWKSQIVISNKETMGIRKMPYAFTEQGVSMLSAILRSPTAIEVSIKIIDSFVYMRRYIFQNALLFERVDLLERKQQTTEQKIDTTVEIFDDRIEFFNQGKLPEELSIEKIKTGKYRSMPRNLQIADVFKAANIIERYGSGIKRVIATFRAYGLKEPTFEATQGEMPVTAYKEKVNAPVNAKNRQ